MNNLKQYDGNWKMMSEKRFQLNNNIAHNIRRAASIIGLDLDYVSHFFIDNKNGGKYLTPHEIVDLLNSLSKENEQLKSENKKLQCINDQLEERLENSGIGVALKMDCDENDGSN